MTSISNIMNTAASALAAAQTQVQVTSENVSNANTAGYSRKVANQQEVVAAGQGEGVTITGIQNAANQFLLQASLSAASQSGSAQAISSTLDQAQTLLGDPSSASSFFSGLDSVYSALSTASDSPASTIDNQAAITALQSFLNQAQSVSSGVQQLQTQATQQVGTDVTTINGLLQQISQLNGTISQATLSGNDPTGAQDKQNQLVSQLSGLMGVKVQPTSTGGVTVRSIDGVYLAGDQGGASLSVSQSGSSTVLTATPPNGSGSQTVTPAGGTVGGLIQLTDVSLPQISAQVGAYVSSAVNQLNAASNASTSVPAPSSLTGRQTGMALSTAISGFSGTTNVAIVNSSGVIQKQVAIDFSAGSMTVGGVSTSFTPATFLSTLNTELGTSGSASFTNGALSISATGAGNGVSIADSTTTPSSNAGQGFSQFFGLNDLVVSSANTHLNTGLTSADPNTFSGTLTLSLADSSGANVRTTTITMPTGGTMANVLSALNSGVGAYGSFSLDTNGALVFTSNSSTPVTVSAGQDATTNSAGGPSFSQMFAIGDSATANLTGTYSVRSDIASNAGKLQTSTLNLSAAAGSAALLSGDGSGLLAMAQSGSKAITIPGVGGLASASNTVTGYASQIAGLIGTNISAADNLSTTAQATATQASSALSSATGVNMDQELVNLTTFQQAYSASARLLQAANSMYDSLLQMVP
ncbi:MAG TPA: flagellar hook-associated protein FlgK [Caulobacteraceae bacterium]|nr:flagellar hook-associated protein FlgK [Caulobacteraceae bacterium]